MRIIDWSSDLCSSDLLFVAVAIIAALGLGFVLSRAISTPLRRTVEVLNRAADGDLTSRLEVSTNDEVGQAGTALNKMLERTSEVWRAIGGNAGRSEERRDGKAWGGTCGSGGEA